MFKQPDYRSNRPRLTKVPQRLTMYHTMSMKNISLRIDHETVERVNRLAAKESRKPTELMRILLGEALKARRAPKVSNAKQA